MSQEILSPVAQQQGGRKPAAVARNKRRRKPVIGLLNNSKPNVVYFLAAVERELHALAIPYETISVVKPRSAGPSPDIELLAARCDYVINAVAD